MQRAARATTRRWLSAKVPSSPLLKHFNENPEKAMAVFRGLDTLGMGPDAAQLRSILVTLSRAQHNAEMKEVLEYALKRKVSINWSDFFRTGVEHTQSPLDLIALFEAAVALDPTSMPTSSYITMVRQCLKAGDIPRALKLYAHIEQHEFKLHQLNKSIMRVLQELAASPAPSAAVEKAQRLTLDLFVRRRAEPIDMAAYIDAITAVHPPALVLCLRMILRKDTSPVPDHRQLEVRNHVANAAPIFVYCNAHKIPVATELYTWYFLKCKRIQADAAPIVNILLRDYAEKRMVPTLATTMSAVHVCISARENELALAVFRVALDAALPLDQWHFNAGLWLCSKTQDHAMALSLFSRMQTTEGITPSEKTLTSVLLNLRQSTDGWDLPGVLGYFASHKIKPTSWEYSQLVEILSSTPSIAYPDMEQLKPAPNAPKPKPGKKKRTPAEKDLAATEAVRMKPKRTHSVNETLTRRQPRVPRTARASREGSPRQQGAAAERKSWTPLPEAQPEARGETLKAPEPKKDSSCSIM
ncbi:hypothetical protein ACHHYP_11182 [Achlya hypogyna]|uniref:Pentacotripeptide-repeat region of PRORP domain-containing protein n=1 Tax=Achlya hypogyna TaxID=1202772 RepID=A0A1V9YJK8_ACHHY|nr:hypothetical protein ACHHYP_11182 [Achlya hypogyna]